jgi:D-arabinan exo alpha-(1,3)/(1,5)-arabinofuranosidase (non-reducing end)
MRTIVYLLLAIAMGHCLASVATEQPPVSAPEKSNRSSSQALESAADASAMPPGLNFGLGSLPLVNDAQTRSISPENPTGEKGKGAMLGPSADDPSPDNKYYAHLGHGWKSRAFVTFNAGETKTLIDVDGPGVIQHVWVVADDGTDREAKWQSSVLRFYWVDEATPSVEVPLSDFFAVGHGEFAPVNSLPVLVNTQSAFNAFWPMPFRHHARISLINECKSNIRLLTYQITYVLSPIPANAAYFHAQYRRASTAQQNPYVILDGVKGKGQYVGTFLAWSQITDGAQWFGEGEIKFYLDGDKDFPTICGTGTEDYFLSSYGFSKPYSTPFVGMTLMRAAPKRDPSVKGKMKWSMYRWHVMDPIRFQQDIHVTIQGLGWVNRHGHSEVERTKDEVASVAFWYQTEPHAPFPALPSVQERTRDAFKRRGVAQGTATQ